jgi:hypothetical protein
LQRSFRQNLQFNTSYTWSKTLDYNSLNSQGIVIQDSTNPRRDYGPADFDARHRFVFSGVYALPFKANRLVSGWQLATAVQLQTGNPFTVRNSSNTLLGTATQRANILGDVPTGYAHVGQNIQYIPQAVCTTVTPGCLFQTNSTTLGSTGRGALYGPGFENIDLNLTKDTKLTERFTLQFRADAFNLFNHPNFGQPNATLNPTSIGTFGQISSTRFATGDSGSSRQLQLALKVLF